ncbi:hypothetical protein J2853_006947 [Streptosporangium lutulentum]|uniref:DUF4245 domain-containing protein n=2 Tax=Streptosporangium lutulentum TaxID=1461250 RepID=A0ABT9QLV3_9ACTN|nr:hypothetical protein [Streptosporangium lutulentum]MDP9847736.1 hypothetical protein [Streptosporangium lutulentum]
MSQFEPRALAEETISIAPQRSVARAKAIFAIAVVLAAAAAGSACAVDSQPAQTAASTPVAGTPAPKVDGVEVRYLPDGLGQPKAVPATAADLHGKALRWRDSEGGRMVQVSVYRPQQKISDALDILALNVMQQPVEPRKATDPVVSEDRTDMMWVADHGLVLRVTTSESAKGALDAIVQGLHVS